MNLLYVLSIVNVCLIVMLGLFVLLFAQKDRLNKLFFYVVVFVVFVVILLNFFDYLIPYMAAHIVWRYVWRDICKFVSQTCIFMLVIYPFYIKYRITKGKRILKYLKFCRTWNIREYTIGKHFMYKHSCWLLKILERIIFVVFFVYLFSKPNNF